MLLDHMTRFLYAQTNLQLLNQLQHEGYTKAELGSIRAAYNLAAHLFTGYFLASGRTQIAHVVGTASILGSLHVPWEMVAAALIHNVYRTGDFGCGRKGISKVKRREIKMAVGSKVERYVYGLQVLRTKSQSISLINTDPAAVDPIGRNALLIEFADRLEHHVSDGGGGRYLRWYINRNAQLMVEIAQKLGFPTLATELKRAFREPFSDKVLVELISQINQNRSPVIVPKSYRKHLRVACRQEVTRRFHYLCATFGMGKSLRRLTRRFCGSGLAN